MRILLTNDDGINARGLDLLETVAQDYPADAIYIFGHGNPKFGVTGKRADLLVLAGNRAMDFDMNNVEEISVLRGAAATALYGSRAANGVGSTPVGAAAAASRRCSSAVPSSRSESYHSNPAR